VYEGGVLQFEFTPEPFTTKGAVAVADAGVGSTLNPYRNQGGYQFLAPGIFTDSEGKTIFGIPSPGECQEAQNLLAEGFITENEFPPFCDFGGFISSLIEIAIALAAVFLVIKLVASGFEYMLTSIPNVKIDAKLKIWESIIGIVLALTSYVILNTINPKLVNSSVGLKQAVLLTDDDDNELYVGKDQEVISIPTGSVARCKDGIEEVKSPGGNIFYVCKSISKKVSAMITAAWNQGIKLGGGGFRKHEEQIELRKKNCGGNSQYIIFQKPSDECTPPTARPGFSRHESGLAIDFNCDGKPIQSATNKCFKWLKESARYHGLINFKKEPWHWSVDGK